MIGIQNKDSSFFQISSPDVDLTEIDMSKETVSLSITERMGAMPQGTLKFLDPFHAFSRILRTGAELNISWGYKNFGKTIDSKDALSLDEITGDIERRGLKGFVSSPGGSGSSSGVIAYDCNFTSYGFRGDDKTETFDSGNRTGVISQAFNDLGILPSNQIIDFSIGREALNPRRSVRQDETTYLFLTRLAREWRAVFTISFNNKGLAVGIFVDPEKLNTSNIPFRVNGQKGSAHELGYKGKVNNVKSYKWSSNESENGVGANVRLEIIDGQPVFRRFVAGEETVISYKLNTEKIKSAIKDKEVDGIVAQTKFVRELLSTKTFDQIKHFFDAYESTTAPQGFGYRVTAETIGNPLYSPPNQIRLVNGFPDRLGSSQAIYYLNEVTHNIGKSGYNTTLQIVDVFAFSDIGQGIL